MPFLLPSIHACPVGEAKVRHRMLVALLTLALSRQALAQEPRPLPSLRLGLQGSYHGPLGPVGMAVGYYGRWLSAGIGLGLIKQSYAWGYAWPKDVFVDANVWRAGALSLAVGATLSRSIQRSHQYYGQSTQVWESMDWTWNPGYRLDASVAIEWGNDWGSLRLEPGLGYFLNSPTCTYSGPSTSGQPNLFTGDCNAREIPSKYHFALPPGRLVPSIGATASVHFGGSLVGGGAESPRAEGWTARNWVDSVLFGDLVGATGALALGGAFWGLTHGDCSKRSSGDDGNGAFCGVVETLVGATLGWVVGTTSGVYVVGRRSVRSDGSWGWTLLGMLSGASLAGAGTLLSYEAGNGMKPHNRNVFTLASAVVLFATIPSGMAALFYKRSASAPLPQ